MTLQMTLEQSLKTVPDGVAAGYVDLSTGALLSIFAPEQKPQEFLNAMASAVTELFEAPLFKMIDKCKSLGMTTNITDDANYWKHRSVERLLAESERWDELIAGFAGRMSDRLGDEIEIAAPIKQRADFEHLEARGQRHLTVKRKRKKRP